MTYFSFLAFFLLIPSLVLLVITWHDERKGKTISGFKNGGAVWLGIGLHILVAVIYTTPWDNYLVATGVWYYNPSLVSGVLIGYVPIEEYTFFIVESFLTGLWWWFLARRIPPPVVFNPSRRMRVASTMVLVGFWAISAVFLASGLPSTTYLAITLIWALLPIGLQLAFGADILWHHRKLVALTILPLTLYLSLVDSLAIASGTWTISPANSTGIFWGPLPIEEAVFFFLTNILVGFGLTLLLANGSTARAVSLSDKIKTCRPGD
jgi:lycopene cyclase domain-containing protein